MTNLVKESLTVRILLVYIFSIPEAGGTNCENATTRSWYNIMWVVCVYYVLICMQENRKSWKFP